MKFSVVIPARYASSRFPGKPLADIHGRPMVVRVEPMRYAVLHTTHGPVTMAFYYDVAPNTVSSVLALAEQGYYDGLTFHRIVPGFVIQGGDPTQTGTGGPGYATLDVPPGAARYTKGTVAMAKSGLEPAGTAGSQFFVVTADGVNLPAEYAIVGKVSEGMDVVERIGELGDAQEMPTQPVVISTVTVSES